MASPRNIHPTFQPQHHYQEDEHLLSYGKASRLESASLESNRTDLSLNSRDVVVAETWLVLGKIGEGSFGEVFEVRDINTKRHYAIKRETKNTKHPQLKFENVMYDVLAGGIGIPQCHWYGQFDGFDCIVMDLLGPNLRQVHENVSCMDLDIAVDLVCQMVSIVEHIHNRGVIVRDVKPDNFLFSANCYLPEMEMVESIGDHGMPVITYKKSTCRQVFEEQWGESSPRLYAVDFGLACYWRDPETGVPYHDAAKRRHRSKTGTARYASINVHKGKSHSRRDDVESIGYILLDLLLGTLPWTGISAKNSKMGWDRMRQMKVDTVMADLCAGLPVGVLEFVEYPRSLQFFDQPDYERMRYYLKESLPGGIYSSIVNAPSLDREAQSTDNNNAIQQEFEVLLQKQKQEEQQQQQQQQRQYNRNKNMDGAPINNDDDHSGLFAMDDLTNQLSIAALSESKLPRPRHDEKATASSSPFHQLPKRNRKTKVGWNTHKHDDELWNTKTNWAEKDTSIADHLTNSWGDDDQPTAGKWAMPFDNGSQQNTDDKDEINHWQTNDPQPLQAKLDDGNEGRQHQLQHREFRRPSLTERQPYRQQQHRHHHHDQSHHRRRYSHPSKPIATQQQLQNTSSNRRYHGVDGGQAFQHQPHRRQHHPTTDMAYGYNRRPSHYRNIHNSNNSLQEATGVVNSWPKKNEPTIM